MIKIETLTAAGTVTRDGEQCTLFVGMELNEGELETLTGAGSFSVDEGHIVTFGAKAAPEAPKQAGKPAA